MASSLTRITRIARLARPLALSQHNPSSASTIRHASSNPFQTNPSPPRLPADQQAEFERLQRTANTQEGFNPTSTPDFHTSTSPSTSDSTTTAADGQIAAVAIEEGNEFASVPLRKGAPPEFEGDVNPKTGEVGGPKNEPLRWGAGGDYSFNGRVTDF
ncbi:DUF1674-domain-containing protein [Hypoxylon rubiginosum]|uniref:DUF1674-domain-containing protein n=1 Tax=Hypoxylon rubiginosum TaxID=110542 RepID=A0ACC0D860_9PEZI|nr:DUF1674-domain-containing protein [Hypoxylon rubiginosum]